MFWWTTLLYTVPVSEKELMAQCDVVLVYIRDGIFGEPEPIRGPASTPKTDVKHDNTDVTPESTNAPHTEDCDKT